MARHNTLSGRIYPDLIRKERREALSESHRQADWLMIVAAVFCFARLPALAAAAGIAPRAAPLNVLMICVDDLRPQLGCYGHSEMVTPAMDRLAREGRQFNRQYVQVPTCGASRAAMLTGLYPARPDAYDNGALATRPAAEAAAGISLPQLFKQNGYHTVSIGKITHEPSGLRADGRPELPFSWDEIESPAGKWGSAWNAFFGYADGSTRIVNKSPATEAADVLDDGYPDGLIAQAAMEKLRELKDRPFFLAVGFYKPHLSFNAPRQYWDLYDPQKLPAPPNPAPPRGVDPAISLHKSTELTPRYTGLATPGIVTEAEARHLRQGYDACVSYVDAQVGKVLDELDRLGLRERTIVVLWGDHGWHLGEDGIWGKHTLYEVALRSPLIVRTPDAAAPGEAADGIVETVDLYPTLAELCHLNAPANLDGRSFAALLADPKAPGKAAAFGFWARGRAHSIRTDRYRLTIWKSARDPSRIVQVELYDHVADPDETQNIAAEHEAIVRELSAQLQATVPLLRSEHPATRARANSQ
jgi:arylsulfatase A-like enzyme